MQQENFVVVDEADAGLELAMQELETMDAPTWSTVASAIISLAGGFSISLAVT
jgi:hypothetical protein